MKSKLKKNPYFKIKTFIWLTKKLYKFFFICTHAYHLVHDDEDPRRRRRRWWWWWWWAFLNCFYIMLPIFLFFTFTFAFTFHWFFYLLSSLFYFFLSSPSSTSTWWWRKTKLKEKKFVKKKIRKNLGDGIYLFACDALTQHPKDAMIIHKDEQDEKQSKNNL